MEILLATSITIGGIALIAWFLVRTLGTRFREDSRLLGEAEARIVSRLHAEVQLVQDASKLSRDDLEKRVTAELQILHQQVAMMRDRYHDLSQVVHATAGRIGIVVRNGAKTEEP